MSFDDDIADAADLCRIPLSIAPMKAERAAWERAARERNLDLHEWMKSALNEAAGSPQTWFEQRMLVRR